MCQAYGMIFQFTGSGFEYLKPTGVELQYHLKPAGAGIRISQAYGAGI